MEISGKDKEECIKIGNSFSGNGKYVEDLLAQKDVDIIRLLSLHTINIFQKSENIQNISTNLKKFADNKILPRETQITLVNRFINMEWQSLSKELIVHDPSLIGEIYPDRFKQILEFDEDFARYILNNFPQNQMVNILGYINRNVYEKFKDILEPHYQTIESNEEYDDNEGEPIVPDFDEQ